MLPGLLPGQTRKSQRDQSTSWVRRSRRWGSRVRPLPSAPWRRATRRSRRAPSAVDADLDAGDVTLARQLRQAGHELGLEEPHVGGQRGVVAQRPRATSRRSRRAGCGPPSTRPPHQPSARTPPRRPPATGRRDGPGTRSIVSPSRTGAGGPPGRGRHATEQVNHTASPRIGAARSARAGVRRLGGRAQRGDAGLTGAARRRPGGAPRRAGRPAAAPRPWSAASGRRGGWPAARRSGRDRARENTSSSSSTGGESTAAVTTWCTASRSASASVRCSPWLACVRAGAPPIDSATSSRCGPTVDTPRRTSSDRAAASAAARPEPSAASRSTAPPGAPAGTGAAVAPPTPSRTRPRRWPAGGPGRRRSRRASGASGRAGRHGPRPGPRRRRPACRPRRRA